MPATGSVQANPAASHMEGANTILCLSSGLMPQYRLDILRAMALPSGSFIQFRYGQALVEEGLRASLANNQCRGSRTILAHVDTNESEKRPGGECPITPCRLGRLESSQLSGSYFILQFSLGQFLYTKDWSVLDSQIEVARPKWTNASSESESSLSGLWCFKTNLTVDTTTVDELQAWEMTINHLWRTPDFGKQPFFLGVEGVYERGRSTLQRKTPSANGDYLLQSDRSYELRVRHWHPEGDEHKMPAGSATMCLKVEQPGLRIVTTPLLPVDSPYDVKTFHVRATTSTKQEYSSLVVSIQDKDSKPISVHPELYMPARVKPAIARIMLIGLVLAVLLWLQQFVPLRSKGPVDTGIILATGFLSLLAAFVVVFGLKKPLS